MTPARTLRFQVSADRLEDAEERLWALGAQAVTLIDAADQPLHEPGPGQTPVWDRMVLEALMPADADPERVLLALAGHGLIDSAGEVEFGELVERDWVRAWMDRFRPMRFGRSIWICPTHIEPDPGWPVVVRLDPGLAFGTGTHPTTALCLQWLDGLAIDGKRVVDYGSGSGVLAVAAALKGASRVLAIDHDPQALEATMDNAKRNGVADRIEAVLPDAASRPQADIVVANILAGPLIALAPKIIDCLGPGGKLALSGVLAEQADSVQTAYASRLAFEGRFDLEDWVRLDFTAPGRAGE